MKSLNDHQTPFLVRGWGLGTRLKFLMLVVRDRCTSILLFKYLNGQVSLVPCFQYSKVAESPVLSDVERTARKNGS